MGGTGELGVLLELLWVRSIFRFLFYFFLFFTFFFELGSGQDRTGQDKTRQPNRVEVTNNAVDHGRFFSGIIYIYLFYLPCLPTYSYSLYHFERMCGGCETVNN